MAEVAAQPRQDRPRLGIGDASVVLRVELLGVPHVLVVHAPRPPIGAARRARLEHVARPVLAIGLIARMLRPGGLLFWSAPFTERFHLIPGDFFRYTVLGARTLLEDAGLRVEHTQRWGNSMITSGWLLGFGVGDFTPQYLEKHMWTEVTGTSVKWLNRKPNFLYMNTGLVARKPRDASGEVTGGGNTH